MQEQAKERQRETLKKGDEKPVPANLPDREKGQTRDKMAADDFRLIIGRIYNRSKKAQGGDRKSSVQNEHMKKPERTAVAVAKEHSVSESTVRLAGRLAKAVKELQKGKPRQWLTDRA